MTKILKISLALLLATGNMQIRPEQTIKWTTNPWSVSQEVFDYIRKTIPEGETIVELGSGWASNQFSKFYTVFSVEHDPKWLAKYDTNYIYAPIKNSWYDPEILAKQLPKNYNLILVDGPTGAIGRYGFCTYLHLFKTDVIIIFDDVHREAEYKLMIDVAEKLKKDFTIHTDRFGKQFGIIDNR